MHDTTASMQQQVTYTRKNDILEITAYCVL